MQLYVKTIDMVVNFRDVDQCSGSLMEIQIHFQIRQGKIIFENREKYLRISK